MYENKVVNGVRLSRYIASWLNVGGKIYYDHESQWYKWLESLGFSEDDIWNATNMALNGKLELEVSAKEFLTKEK